MSDSIAILPLGSFEQHGPHLPLGTDIYQVDAISKGVAERLGAFLLPVQPLSTCYEHHGKKGSFHFTANVFYRFLVNICENLYKNGYDKIVIMPGHGGIFILEPAVNHLNYKYDGLTVIIANPYEMSDMPGCPFDGGGVHAEEMEASLMLHLKPETVDMSKAVDYTPKYPRPFMNYGSIFTICPDGVWGNSSGAAADKGKWAVEACIKSCVNQINILFGILEGVK
jgi:creatinine amidohydrolase